MKGQLGEVQREIKAVNEKIGSVEKRLEGMERQFSLVADVYEVKSF